MKFFGLLISIMMFTRIISYAQEVSSQKIINEISIAGGLSVPSVPEQFKKYWNNGFYVGISAGHIYEPGSIGCSRVYIIAEYQNFPFDETRFREDNSALNNSVKVEGKSRSIIDFALLYEGKFSKLNDFIHPYFLLGVGYYNGTLLEVVAAGLPVSFTDSTKSTMAWQFGLGFDVPAGDRLTFFAEAKLLQAFTGDWGTQYYPISVGVRLKP